MPYLLCNGPVVFEELKFEHWSPISTQHETTKTQMHHWIRSAFWDLNFKLISKCQLSPMSSCQSDLFSVSTSKAFEARSMLFAHGKFDLWTDCQWWPAKSIRASHGSTAEGFGRQWKPAVFARHDLSERKAVEEKDIMMKAWQIAIEMTFLYWCVIELGELRV